MQKRTPIAFYGGVTLVSALFGAWLAVGSHTVTLSQEQIQARIDARLPHMAAGVTVSSVAIRLGDGRAELAASAEANRLGRNARIDIRAIGVPRYDPRAGAFYFNPDSFRIERLEVDGGSPGQRLQETTTRLLGRGANLQQLVERNAERIETWVSGAAERSVALALERVPIYRLRDGARGFIVRSALESVEVRDDRLVIRLTLWALTWNLVAALFGFVLFLLILNWFLRGMLLSLLLLLVRR